MKHTRRIMLFMCLPALMIQVHARAAKLYKWTDSEGKVHYSQFQPAATDSRQTKTIRIHSSPKPAAEEAPETDTSQPGDKHKITLEEYCAEEEAYHNYPLECQQLKANQIVQEREKKRAEQDAARKKQAAEQNAKIQKLQDQATVAECRRRRETFCNQPPEGIRLCFAYQSAKQQCLNDPYYSRPSVQYDPGAHVGSSARLASCLQEKRDAYRKRGARDCW